MTTQHALEQYQYSLVFFLAYFGFKGSEESLYFTSLCTFKHQTNLSLNAGTITQKKQSYWCIHHQGLLYTNR